MEYDLLLRERGSASRAYLAGVFEEQGLKPQPLWESASTHALVEAVSKGLGISLLPRMLVQRDIDAGQVPDSGGRGFSESLPRDGGHRTAAVLSLMRLVSLAIQLRL